MALTAVVVAVVAALGIPGRATLGAQVTADEPQYLLTAGALFHRHDLDIGPDLRAETWRAYHRAELPVQTAALAGGQRLSPHDPLLPALLAVPFGLGGWVGAKLALAALAGVLAAVLVWTAVVRLRVPVEPAAVVVGGFGVVPPLVAYGSQVYPELPAALAVVVAVAALTGRPSARTASCWVLAVVALPWLAVKYAPVAAALALVGLAALVAARRHRLLAGVLAAFAVAGALFAAVHQAIYGGWTVYAVGDHFADGELTVMGARPNYPGRSVRLVGLLVDHDFGLVAWAPVFLFSVAALAALLRRRPPGWLALALPLAAGWLNATFVALTMQGWWWPGRQVVVVVPLLVLATAWWAGTVVSWHRVRPWFLAATAFGVVAWAWLQVEVARGTRTVIVDFASTSNPLSRLWRLALPDLRVLAGVDVVRLVATTAVLAVIAVAGWRSAGPGRPAPRGSADGDEDAGAGEGPDADVAALDLHGGGAVGR